MNCQCDDPDVSRFVDAYHGHIVTGNLEIVQSVELRNIMKKGAKFRETPPISYEKLEQSLHRDIDNFVLKWINKEEKDSFVIEIENWHRLVKQKISEKIALIRVSNRNLPSKAVLSKASVRHELDRLQQKYVITIVDKCSNNFAIQCKKFYFLQGAKDLGLNDVGGATTYRLVPEDKNTIRNRIAREIKLKFNIDTEYENFPLIFWNAKFHKDPIKFRPIAGSRKKVLYPLEQVVGKIMKSLTSHFTAYCRVCERQTGKKHYFAIKNSIEMKNVLMSLKDKATSFDSFDFSNLYTNFKHAEILERLNWIIDVLYENAGKEFVCVNKLLNKVEYSDQEISNDDGWTFNKDNLKEVIKYLINNTYVEFGSLILKQIVGIPMGSIPAPDFANLALAVDEYKFVKKMLHDQNFPVLNKLNNCCRYLDDIGTPNFSDFAVHARDIYCDSLTLTRSNRSSTDNVAFLDLSVSVYDRKFETRIYCKTDDYNFVVISLPFIESNVSTEMCFYVYFGQILRFLRVCSKLQYFIERSIFLTRMLQERGYNSPRLASKFNQVILRHRQDWSKFAALISTKELMMRVIYTG